MPTARQMISPEAVELARRREAAEARRMLDHPLTETGNAERFAWEHRRNARYCKPLRKWFLWDDARWRPDDTGRVEQLAKETIRGIAQAAADCDNDKHRAALMSWALKSETAGARAAMLQLAQSEDGIPVLPDFLDADPFLLNVTNGTIELRTGRLREHERRDLITKMAPVIYDPDAKAPTWLVFLERVTDGNAELQGFLQRAAGYALTGDVSAEALFFNVGRGANGKSTFVNRLQDVLGEYARSLRSDVLLAAGERAPNSASPDVMALKGVRLGVCSETNEGSSFNAAQVKQITGKDKIAARALYAETTEFNPTHKLFLSTNHRPRVRSADDGTWRRILLVPFAVTIPEAEQDPLLSDKLRRELPGILAWAVRGCLDWQARGGGRAGLAAPAVVLNATNEYREQEDSLAPFFAEECIIERSARIPRSDLYKAYRAWCQRAEEREVSARSFAMRVQEIDGVSPGKSGGVRLWVGIRPDGKDAA